MARSTAVTGSRWCLSLNSTWSAAIPAAKRSPSMDAARPTTSAAACSSDASSGTRSAGASIDRQRTIDGPVAQIGPKHGTKTLNLEEDEAKPIFQDDGRRRGHPVPKPPSNQFRKTRERQRARAAG